MHSVAVIPRWVKFAATTAPPPIPMLISTFTVVSTTASPSTATPRRRDVATRRKLSQLIVSVSKVATFPEPTFPVLPPERNERTIIASAECLRTKACRVRVGRVGRVVSGHPGLPQPRAAAAQLDFHERKNKRLGPGRHALAAHQSSLWLPVLTSHTRIAAKSAPWRVEPDERRSKLDPREFPTAPFSLHVPHTDPRFCILIRPTKSTRPCSSLISLHRRKTQKKYRRALGILCPDLQRLNGAHRGVAQSSPCARRLSTGSAGAG